MLATRPREPVEAPVRFETPPGHQGQVDFGTFTLPWGRRHALVIVLGYSRLLWLHFYPRQTMAVLMEALEYQGGVPEELLFDSSLAPAARMARRTAFPLWEPRFNEQAARWLEGTANVRRHATTGERP